jgi:hypothetical protein
MARGGFWCTRRCRATVVCGAGFFLLISSVLLLRGSTSAGGTDKSMRLADQRRVEQPTKMTLPK